MLEMEDHLLTAVGVLMASRTDENTRRIDEQGR